MKALMDLTGKFLNVCADAQIAMQKVVAANLAELMDSARVAIEEAEAALKDSALPGAVKRLNKLQEEVAEVIAPHAEAITAAAMPLQEAADRLSATWRGLTRDTPPQAEDDDSDEPTATKAAAVRRLREDRAGLESRVGQLAERGIAMGNMAGHGFLKLAKALRASLDERGYLTYHELQSLEQGERDSEYQAASNQVILHKI